MIIYYNNDGLIVRILMPDDPFGEPASYDDQLELDSDTNQHIVTALTTAFNDVTVSAGVIYLSGTPLTINPPGPAWLQRLVQENSDAEASSIPVWASYTIAEALAWHDANIRDPINAAPAVTSGNAVAVLQAVVDMLKLLETENRALLRMVLALRNKTWPGLEGS